MEKLFFALESCDYRVHLFVTKALENVAAGNGCRVCVHNAGMQLVFCRAVGYGTDHGIDKDMEYLERSGKTMVEVENAIQRIKNENKRSDVIMAQLAKQGYRHDFATLYTRDGVLSDAIEYYRRAVEKRRILFEPGHFSSLRLKGILLTLLRQNDQLHEGIELAREMAKEVLESNIQDQIEVKENLAHLLLELGALREAEE